MRTRYIQDKKGRLIQVDQNWTPEPRSDYHIMPDIKPYKSMADGTMVTSRSVQREMLARNNCIQIGNDSSLYRKPQPIQPPPGLKEKVIRAVELQEAKARRR